MGNCAARQLIRGVWAAAVLGMGFFRDGKRLELLQFVHRLLPILGPFLGRNRSIRISIESENVISQLRRYLVEVVLRQLIQQLSIGLVGQRIFPSVCESAGIEVSVN